MIPKLGSCYYPEHWSETQWEKDAKDMIESGLTWVRIGEFAWSRLEPEEGAQNFKWLDRAIEVLGNAGLNVVMSTPTAAPPRWVVDKWPDMLLVDSDGRSRKFGSRRHYCFSHQGYLQESSRITRLVAKRYGKNPYIKAQIKAYSLIKKFRDKGVDCHSIIMLQVESPLRSKHFFIKKVCSHAKLGNKIKVGNINTIRDYSWAPEIAQGIY